MFWSLRGEERKTAQKEMHLKEKVLKNENQHK